MLNLEIVTPEKKVLNDTVDAVTVPTISGEVGILSDHAPLISALKPGILSYTRGGATERIMIAGGFLEVSANKVSVLADTAESAGEIDVEAARTERETVEKNLGVWKGTEEEFETQKDRLEKAQARLQLASGK
ncbi:MAG TPA: F0F1 ATP synthase subunit epsilon [Pyrinomonadaceae bacterium]|nr:F0F1 ATP synthase subunit epsilon [Pyrinomonadaceae bacterium]